MIISLYTTKGGAGKSTSVVTIVGAIAEINSETPESMIKVLCLDNDMQKTTMGFSAARTRAELPDYGIAYQYLPLTELTPTTLSDLSEGYDITIVDFPGFYSQEAMRTCHYV